MGEKVSYNRAIPLFYRVFVMSDPVSADLQSKRRASRARLEKLAYWLDDAFRIPFTNKRIGIDGILGLLPFAGDFGGMVLSSLMIGEAVRLGAPKRVWLRMGANVGVDFLIGLVPIAGDVFDIFYKANRRNQRVLVRWLDEATRDTQHRPSSSAGSATVTIVVSLALGLVVAIGLWRAVFG